MKVIKAEDTRSLEPFRDRIIEGDCLEVMKGIPGESIDMILCDLPYGTTQNKWDSIINLDLLFTEYMRIIKPHGAIVLTSTKVKPTTREFAKISSLEAMVLFPRST